MKKTASSPDATTQHQNEKSRQQQGPGAAAHGDKSTSAASASQRADGPAKRGEPLPADKPVERAPKQENL